MLYSELWQQVTPTPRNPMAGRLSLDVPPDWMQGRSIFGGLQTALGLKAMRSVVPPSVPVRSLQTTFVAPPSSSMVMTEATVLRRGKSATHAQALLLDANHPLEVLAVIMGVFGAARPSALSLQPEQPALESAKAIPFRYVEGVTPTFTQHFDATWLKGAPPFTGTDETSAIMSLAMPSETECTEAHVVALADFVPPLALSMLDKPAPGSSMTWMLDFLHHDFSELRLADWRVDAELVAGRDGYTSQSVMLWGPGGLPVARSHQSMVVFG